MKVVIMEFPPVCCRFFHHRPKYHPQHDIIEYLETTLLVILHLVSCIFLNTVFLSSVTSATVLRNKFAQAVTVPICTREMPGSNL